MKTILAAVVAGSLLTIASTTGAAQAKSAAKAKPYPLKTCMVTDENFGGDMGKPYVFTHQGREIKLCCKSCLKNFNKDTAKYMKKLENAEKSGKKPAASKSAVHDHSGHKH